MSALRLSIIMPIYNEEKTLAEITRRVIQACGAFAEIIFVDDGSTDQSLAIARSLARQEDVVITKPNGGKGSAVRAGYERAKGIYVVTQDADLEYDPKELKIMLEFAEAEEMPAVFGSRRIKKQRQYAHVKFYIGGTVLTWIFNILYGYHLTDQPNCYKMLRRDVLQTFRLTENDFRLDSELTALLGRAHLPIAEVPTSYHPRSVAEGKKIRAIDWFKAVWVFLKFRFLSRAQLYR